LLDLTSDIPVSGAVFVLIEALDDGSLNTQVTAAPKTSWQLLTLDDIPSPSTNGYPIAAVRMYKSQTEFFKNDQINDVLDLRWSGFASSAHAGIVDIADAGSYYSDGTVEGALQEIGDGTTLDARYVNVSGDTMTGGLTINTDSLTALLVEQSGVHDNVLAVDTTNGGVGINTAPASTKGLNVAFFDASTTNNARGASFTYSSTGARSAGSTAAFEAFNLITAGNAWITYGLNGLVENRVVGAGLVGVVVYGAGSYVRHQDGATITGTMNYGIGFESSVMANYGTITTANSGSFEASISTLAGRTGHITTAYSLYAQAPRASGGTITTGYGLYIKESATPATTHYGIYSNDRVMIDGSADLIQLRVQGHSTQTNNLQTWENSAGAVLGYFGGNPLAVYPNAMGFYSQISATGDNSVVGNRLVTAWAPATWTGALIGHCLDIEMYTSGSTLPAASSNIAGIYATVYHNSTGGSLSYLYGIVSDVRAVNSNVSYVSGFRSIVRTSAGKTIAAAYHLHASSTVNAGTITTLVGVYVESMTAGGTNYAIYTNAGLVHFNDQVFVDGSQDLIQFRLQAHSTQTTNMVTLENSAGAVQLAIAGNGRDFILDTTTGSMIGTAANQKLGLWGATPVVQESHITDADGSLADVTAQFNALLASLETIGVLAAV
jgi:hypothetical protein